MGGVGAFETTLLDRFQTALLVREYTDGLSILTLSKFSSWQYMSGRQPKGQEE